MLLILDSLRFDTLVAARLASLGRLGTIERRWSYASWTSPSHYNLLCGLLPHPSPTHVVASTWYRRGFAEWAHRLGVPELTFTGMLPALWLPLHLQQHLGYHTRATVSMPVLNPATPLNVGFDSYVSAPRHNDLGAILDGLVWDPERPTFQLINTGETHYPYAPADEPASHWPKLHGLHGIFAHPEPGAPEAALHEALSRGELVSAATLPPRFDPQRLDALRARQLFATRALDPLLDRLFDEVPTDTWVIVTSDHGELFGEGGHFGHGPIQHDKVFEVPLIEGRVR